MIEKVFLLAYLLLACDDRDGAIGADRSAAVCVDFDAVIASAHGKYACLFHSVWKCVAGLVMIDDGSLRMLRWVDTNLADPAWVW